MELLYQGGDDEERQQGGAESAPGERYLSQKQPTMTPKAMLVLAEERGTGSSSSSSERGVGGGGGREQPSERARRDLGEESDVPADGPKQQQHQARLGDRLQEGPARLAGDAVVGVVPIIASPGTKPARDQA